MRYAREASETTCKRSVAKTTRKANLQKKMTDKDETELETLLNEDEVPPTDQDEANLAKVLQSINNNMANLASSMSNMSEAFAEIRHTPSATAKRDSQAVEFEPLSSNKKRRASHSNEDSDVETLIEVSPGETPGLGPLEADSRKNKEADEEDEFLTTLALEYSADDKTSGPVSTQLADIVNKRWSAKLSDEKFKEKMAKYDRPENCDRLQAPKVNPEIWSRISNTGQRQDLKLVSIQKTLVAVGSAVAKTAQLLMDARQTGGIRRCEGDENNNIMNEVLTLQVDALALLGHTNYELSLRRREMMKPTLNKDYASLCSSQTSVTSMLFGDELHSQLNAIRASNRISQTATQHGHSSSHNKSFFNRRPRNEREKPFLSKGPNSRWTNDRFTSHQKKREGGNKK